MYCFQRSTQYGSAYKKRPPLYLVSRRVRVSAMVRSRSTGRSVACEATISRSVRRNDATRCLTGRTSTSSHMYARDAKGSAIILSVLMRSARCLGSSVLRSLSSWSTWASHGAAMCAALAASVRTTTFVANGSLPATCVSTDRHQSVAIDAYAGPMAAVKMTRSYLESSSSSSHDDDDDPDGAGGGVPRRRRGWASATSAAAATRRRPASATHTTAVQNCGILHQCL
mmetsp:Transcript_15745/g.63417  ORF Transcript_15745/g.63417 Transcript_15745/m.63417 type:complete len:227 (+) Transcript_15745:1173-1853(+)